MERDQIQAIMNIGKDEGIAGMWISRHIPETGYYKLLAKKKKMEHANGFILFSEIMAQRKPLYW